MTSGILRQWRNFSAKSANSTPRSMCSINNAGVAHSLAPVDQLSVETWKEVIDTNLTGTFLVTRAALPLMRAGGTIVNNLSVAALQPFAGMSAYNASKFGALGFTHALREDLRKRGIRVSGVAAGRDRHRNLGPILAGRAKRKDDLSGNRGASGVACRFSSGEHCHRRDSHRACRGRALESQPPIPYRSVIFKRVNIFPRRHELDQQCSGHKSADMGPKSHAANRPIGFRQSRGSATQKIHDDTSNPVPATRAARRQKKPPRQDPRPRIKDQVSSHNAGNRATGANSRALEN